VPLQPVLTQAATSLAAILLLLFAAAWVIQRLRNRGWGNTSTNNPIQITATRSLGPQTTLLIITVHSQQYLVCAHRGTVTPIGPVGGGV
jgi:flagellar biogenesis protein FliO